MRFRKLLPVLVALLLMPRLALAVTGAAGQISVDSGTIAIIGPFAPTTLTAHGVVMGEGTASVAASAAGTSGHPFLSGGASADGAYGALDLSTSAVTGITPIARGGTNAGSLTANRCLRFDGTSIASATGDCGSAINAPMGFGSGMDITTSKTVYAGFGTLIDQTEGKAQVRIGAHNLANLRCVNAAIQGVGNDVVVTGRVGACGSQADGTLTCTIAGTTGGNQTCTDTTNSLSPTAGQCVDFKIVTPAALTANANVGCTVEPTS